MSPFGTGYSEGKWVTEHVLQRATKQRGVHTIVMRLGQVSGNKVGYWNEREWLPALVKSALFQKCLPDVEGVRPMALFDIRAAFSQAFGTEHHLDSCL